MAEAKEKAKHPRSGNHPDSEDYPEIQVPEQEESSEKPETEELSPGKMRRFMRHLSKASTKVETQLKAKADVRQKLDRIKSMALNKRTKKADIESEFDDFEALVHNIVMDEEKILKEQRRETKEIQSLKSMIEDLSNKLVELGREYALEMEKKDKKILELRDNLATARMKASEANDSRKERIAKLEKRIKSKGKTKKSEVRDIEKNLKTLEDTHRKLARSKKHPKKDLDRLKKVIDSHKEKLKKLKK